MLPQQKVQEQNLLGSRINKTELGITTVTRSDSPWKNMASPDVHKAIITGQEYYLQQHANNIIENQRSKREEHAGVPNTEKIQSI